MERGSSGPPEAQKNRF